MRALFAALLAAQTMFSARTDMVAVPVAVLDAAGRPVTTLTQEDFRLYDNGRPVPIAAFQSGETPITLGLVVDYSLSVREKLPAVVVAVNDMAASMRLDDELFLLRFNNQIVVGTGAERIFSSDVHELAAALEEGTPGGGTALYDALLEALHHVRQGTRNRKALVVFSDGGDNSSGRTLDDVVREAQRSDAAIYVVGLDDPGENRRDTRTLKRLAERSGGAAWFPRSADVAAATLSTVAANLREQYTLGFTPDTSIRDGRPHRIEVKVASKQRGKLRVRARSSYELDPAVSAR